MRKPKGFRPAEGILEVQPSDRAPSFFRTRNYTGKFKAGVEYEAAVHSYYSKVYGDKYKANPWYTFKDKNGSRWCQPDALIVDPESNTITILECKLKHCAKSWWQLHKLYLPVVKFAYGADWVYKVIEVTAILDPATLYPCEYNKIDCIPRALAYPVTNVILWRV